MENTRLMEMKWNVNKSQSDIGFRFRYLLFTIAGSFKDYEISVETKGEDFATAKINFRADLTSIDTHNTERDTGVKEYITAHKLPPELSFQFQQIEKVSEHNFKVYGDLTILNITKPIVLDMQFDGIHRSPGDKLSAGFTVHGKIEYLDFVPEDSAIHKIAFALNKNIDIDVSVKLDKAETA